MTAKTAEQVDARIDKHEEVCAERYRNLHATIGELKGSLTAMTVQLSTTQETVSGRLTAISNRMWSMVVGTLVVMTGAFGTVAGFILLGGKGVH